VSLSEHRYTARIAPSSSTASDAIHGGAIIVEDGRRVAESIASGCLTWPIESVPVLLGHDERRRVGFVTDVSERDGWHEATFVLDMDRPLSRVALDLLHVGAPVSIGARSLANDAALANLGTATQIKRHTAIVLEEVSLVEPGFVPQYRGAKVTKIVERETPLARHHRERREREERERARATLSPRPESAARRAPSDRATSSPVLSPDDGEVIHGGRVIRREFKSPMIFRGKRGEVIRNEVDGSQTIWASEADYREDMHAGARR
jgi:hypothetical protein